MKLIDVELVKTAVYLYFEISYNIEDRNNGVDCLLRCNYDVTSRKIKNIWFVQSLKQSWFWVLE